VINRQRAGIPDNPICVTCGVVLTEPFGWCSNCTLAFCDACGGQHFCLPTCQAAGCIVGFCVRRVEGGLLGEWRRPPG
jgi:hypothetical protein